ncbi:MAG: helix-turn-helix transcriptional regulator [Acidobacteriota bacterium]|nr:helix-turn-helix transcriptional regulator [Acidobacteriota bacterium]
MDAKKVIGQYVRRLREEKSLSQDQLASLSGISYQYLSGVENGRENFSIGVLEAIGRSLGFDLVRLITLAFASETGNAQPVVKREYFRAGVPLPKPLTIEHLTDALNETQRVVFMINTALTSIGARPLSGYVQGNNFSGLVSNILCDSFSQLTPFKHNSHQAYPDLVAIEPKTKEQVGLEVKTTIQIGKGGESHNGHSGWHLIGCFQIQPETGNIQFVHVMFAILNGHQSEDSDWTYVGSKVNTETGSRRTETYNTNLYGLTKLRDGSAYLDPTAVEHRRWRQARRSQMPNYSIFNTKP